MRGNGGTLYLNVKDREKLWKAHMSKSINRIKLKMLHRDQLKVFREEVLETFKHIKIGKAPRPSEAYAKMILASGDVGIRALI